MMFILAAHFVNTRFLILYLMIYRKSLAIFFGAEQFCFYLALLRRTLVLFLLLSAVRYELSGMRYQVSGIRYDV